MTGSGVGERLAAVRSRVDSAAREAGRTPAAVTLVGISKRQPLDRLRDAFDAGLREYGENLAQDLRGRAEALGRDCPGIRWHFVGRVQRNKAALIARADLVHGVGAIRHLEALSRASGEQGLPVLLQVNMDNEQQKNGFLPEEVEDAVLVGARLEGVEVRGLMCIPALDRPARPAFAALRELRDQVAAATGHGLPELSMGMSGDFEDAIREGATIVRVGTAIFGPRQA